ncbi:large ribosomal subunit protein mL44-like [Zophobas morio]|uniref:large ribosomal subunit protein mL44-like n=1 Tax=Zophobas morio TaxID=2755281 RepID=UPI003082C2DD
MCPSKWIILENPPKWSSDACRKKLFRFLGYYSRNFAKKVDQSWPHSSVDIEVIKKYKFGNYARIRAYEEKAERLKLRSDHGLIEVQRELFALKNRLHPDLAEEKLAEIFKSNFGLCLPLGNHAVSLHAAEYLNQNYPNLPESCAEDIISYIFLPETLEAIAKNLGIDRVQKLLTADCSKTTLSSIFISFIGLMHLDLSNKESREFLQATVDPVLDQINLKELINVPSPILSFTRTFKNPQFRILRETGRLSSTSVFYVGAFSEGKCVGEGVARSIRMAKNAASQNAFVNLFLQKTPLKKKICSLQG